MMKFKKETSQHGFFATWTCGDVRVLFDKANKGFYKYEVQKLNENVWDKVRSFHTLKEAKLFCEEV